MHDIRKYFPFFNNKQQEIIYLDNAATTQKPQQVIDAQSNWYSFAAAPVHRGVYKLSEAATIQYENARTKLAKFINAKPEETIFTKGTTEGINFIAATWAESNLHAGDEIIITQLEHHANILPWINLAQKKNLVLKYVPVLADGSLDYETYNKLLTPKTKLVSFALSSNTLGTINNYNYMIDLAKAVGAKVLVDAAQFVAHGRIDVKAIGADFLVFSGHKLFGPTGIGVLYIAQYLHEYINPYQFGGGMVFEVDYFRATWLKAPHKYEAGTPPIAQALGLAAAVDFIEQHINFTDLKQHEAYLCKLLIEGLANIAGVRILGAPEQLVNVGHMVSFVSDKFHAHDIAAYLDQYAICVRAGNHCAQILHKKLGISSSVRASFSVYNTAKEINYMVDILSNLFSGK